MKKFRFLQIAFLSIPITIILLASCSTKQDKEARLAEQVNEKIRINQLGYLPDHAKTFWLADESAAQFEVIDTTGKVVYSGDLVEKGLWKPSGESLAEGDFSSFKKQGTYMIHIPGVGNSYPFIISATLYDDAATASMRSFYFQRMSIDMPEKYLGSFAREAGHPDDTCYFHPSSGHSEGFMASPGGWYDAGDYGKYIVNAGVAVGQMLNIFELYPDMFPDGSLDIPESENGVSDMLDELKYELKWMLTMQDKDGGVFHKVTPLHHDGITMPAETHSKRYVIGKSTAATLDFAASMAQASRIYYDTDREFAIKSLKAAEAAFSWALSNPEEYFKNPPGVGTGEYGDVILDEEFFWAAAELYVTTGEDQYYERISSDIGNITFRLEESWRNYVDNIGYYSLFNSARLSQEDRTMLENGIVKLSDKLIKEANDNAYNIPVERFVWGSNSDVLNTTIVHLYAHKIEGRDSYLDAAISATDYVFGKNATGYCFVSGFGSKSTMNFHHRLFMADENEGPFPGFIAGGPNFQMQDAQNLKRWNGVEYPSTLPAKAYIDHEGSYASNELCLNWNAPLVFVLGYLSEK